MGGPGSALSPYMDGVRRLRRGIMYRQLLRSTPVALRSFC